MPRAASWKSPAIASLAKRAKAAGFTLDARARTGLVQILELGNGEDGAMTLAELLQTLLDAIDNGHAFRIAAATQTACLVVRADYQRFVVGVMACTTGDPGGCAGWKLSPWSDDDDNSKRLASWAFKGGAEKLGITFDQPVVKQARTAADRGHERALLADIVANPADDDPRLVYADWLADRDPPRSEFIVLQCQAAKLKGARRTALEKRANDLRIAHRESWGFEWADSVGYQRGFVHTLEAPLASLVTRRATFETTPIEQLLVDLGEVPDLERFFALPLSRITTLWFDYIFDEHALVKALATTRTLERVTTLHLGIMELGADSIALLSLPSTIPSLTTLHVSDRITARRIKRPGVVIKHAD